MRSPRYPHSVHGLPTCIWTRDAGVIAIVRENFVILGALPPGQKWRLYFRGSPPGFSSPFHPTRTILREFWTFRRPRERGPSLHNPSLSFFPFPFFFLLFPPLSLSPFSNASEKLPYLFAGTRNRSMLWPYKMLIDWCPPRPPHAMWSGPTIHPCHGSTSRSCWAGSPSTCSTGGPRDRRCARTASA